MMGDLKERNEAMKAMVVETGGKARTERKRRYVESLILLVALALAGAGWAFTMLAAGNGWGGALVLGAVIIAADRIFTNLKMGYSAENMMQRGMEEITEAVLAQTKSVIAKDMGTESRPTEPPTRRVSSWG